VAAIIERIYQEILRLTGPEFEILIQAILRNAGFQNVLRQSSGSQGGYDIGAAYKGDNWIFEVKKKNEALDENDLAVKFDQIERAPGDADYFIIVTNAKLSNNLRESIRAHRNKWYIDLDYWSSCNDKLRKLLLSYPQPVLDALKNLSSKDADALRRESQEFLRNGKLFLEEELESLRKTSNRFHLLQKVAGSISAIQERSIQPELDFSKLIPREDANRAFEQFQSDMRYSCFIVLAKEQMGKSSLVKIWRESTKFTNISFFFSGRKICKIKWLEELQNQIYREIERCSSGGLQTPRYISTLFDHMQSRLASRSASIYVFVDALNAASYDGIKDFMGSDDFKRSLTEWGFKWIFSCREEAWDEWKKIINIPHKFPEFRLKEFNDKELDLALKSHNMDLAKLPHRLITKMKWPGLLHLCGKMQRENPAKFERMPDMALAEISLMFIRERTNEFAGADPGGISMSKEGVEHTIAKIVDLFNQQKYKALPFRHMQEIGDFDPYQLSENSWNIILQQGFLTKNDENYELGNDWGTVLIGKHLIDVCMRKDMSASDRDRLLDDIFAGIAPIPSKNKIGIADANRFEEVLWFALHYGKIADISEVLFRMILNRVYEGQNLSHDFLSKVAADLFPVYAVRYLGEVSHKNNSDIYLREALENSPPDVVIPELLKLFPETEDKVKMQMAILLGHYKDIRFLEEIYVILDRGVAVKELRDKHSVESKLREVLEHYPDECCELIEGLVDKGAVTNHDLAISLLGQNGTVRHASVLRRLMSGNTGLSAASLIALGELRMTEAEDAAMSMLTSESDPVLLRAAVQALGHIESERFLEWCRAEPDLWKRDYYPDIMNSLQSFKSALAYDLLIDIELRQTKWIPFILFHRQSRLRRLNESQFRRMVEGILNRIQASENIDIIWQGLHNLATFDLSSFSAWWQEYRGTRIPEIIAELMRICGKPEYFTTDETVGASAMTHGLQLLDMIGERNVMVPLLLDLMERDIPRLFTWTLFPLVAKYVDPVYEETLTKMAMHRASDSFSKSDIYDIVQDKAVICLTHMTTDTAAETILRYRQSRWSEDDQEYANDLAHFKAKTMVDKLVEIFRDRDEDLFWSAYCYLWEFLPEDIIEPSFAWLEDTTCQAWIRKYLLKLLGRFDKPAYNVRLGKYLSNPVTLYEAMEALLYSEDPWVHEWFEKRIKSLSTSSIAIGDRKDEVEHAYLLKWIHHNSYVNSRPYLEKWLQASSITWIIAGSLIGSVYRLIDRFGFLDLLETIKNRYYHWNQVWGSHVVAATLKIIYRSEPEWAWNEFLKYWNNMSNSQKKDAIEWVRFMPSETSAKWLIKTYQEFGNFFSDEKAIRQSIGKIFNNFPENIKQHTLKSLHEKAVSDRTSDRIDAAIYSSLFGEDVYKEFEFLLDDQCARVRGLHRYADIYEMSMLA